MAAENGGKRLQDSLALRAPAVLAWQSQRGFLALGGVGAAMPPSSSCATVAVVVMVVVESFRAGQCRQIGDPAALLLW